ncbi:MAG: tetratricopeptide repeat protein [Desulfobacula sp.]|jgi:TPR repeat protein|nr:tetratricopeptide repeat protein [Desulfobacula sp.]
MKVKKCCLTCFLILILTVILTSPPCFAKKSVARELESAQNLLSKGEYNKAYTEYHHFAVKKNNPLAQFTLGLFFKFGWGRPVDPVQACQWFERAGSKGIPAGIYFFAECLEDGVGRDPNSAKAAQFYKRAAELGHYSSLCALAELYMTGKGVPKDSEKALKLCEQAAMKSIVPAQIQMGRFLMEKESGVQDLERSFSWFSQAAAMGAPEAEYYMGLMMRDGLGRPKDPQTAISWFEKAASKGYQKAYFPVGILYFNSPKDPETGMLGAKDLAKSYLWLSASVRQSSDMDVRKEAEKILKKVLEIMPETWKSDLDSKVDTHFQSFPSHQP